MYCPFFLNLNKCVSRKMTSDVKNLFSQQLLYHQYFIYLKGYMDDEFGPTAEWDWGEHAGKNDGENEWKTDEV